MRTFSSEKRPNETLRNVNYVEHAGHDFSHFSLKGLFLFPRNCKFFLKREMDENMIDTNAN